MTNTALRERDAPLARLREAFAGARAGRGQLVLVAGEAGIGKSALASALAEEAARDADVVWGRAWEFAEAPPYWAVWPCMRAHGIEPANVDEGRAFELWESVLEALVRASATRTTVWIVEDLHAADLGTLDLLTFLVQPLRALRVLIVATVRPHDARLGDRKLQRLARMARDGLELRLEPLSNGAVAAIAEDTLGTALAPGALDRLVELTGGNPLFVIECARAFRAGGRTLASLPPTIRQVVTERVSLLPEATRAALAAGAVLGRELSAATVAAMLGSDSARVIDELVPALRAGVVRESRPGHFVFSHVIVRDAIEDAIDSAARRGLHARADAALGEGTAVEIVVERARHALLAAADPAHAMAIAATATDVLERERAFDRAFELQQRIADARATGFLPAASVDEMLHAARIAHEAGRSDVMQRLCDEVARTTRDPDRFARAVLLHASSVRLGVIDPHQIALLREACALCPIESPIGCRLRARMSTALQPADDPREPNDLAREALRGAHALGDDATIRDVLDLAGLGMFGAPRDERIAWCEALRDRALVADDIPKVLNAWSWLAVWHLEGGDWNAYTTACTNALALSTRAAHPRHRWEPLLLASSHACTLGNFAESERYVTEVAQIAALIDDPGLAVALVVHEIMRAKLRGDRAEVTAAFVKLDDAIRDFKHSDLNGTVIRASVFARFGDREATQAQLALVGTRARLLETDLELMWWLGEAYALAGTDADRQWARDVIARGGYVECSGSYIYEGTRERVLGLLDIALGDTAAGVARLRSALDTATARGQRPWVELIEGELARVRGEAITPAVIEHATGVLRMTCAAEVWTIERAGRTARVRDSRGMQLLARLVEQPDDEIHVLALASDEGVSAPESNAGEMLDERARKAYRKRLDELDEGLATAQARSDAAAAARLGREKDAIVKELTRAAGLGGRTRRAASATERARVNVQRRIKDAIARVTEADAELGRYLEDAVRTGTFCCFRPS